LGFGKFTEVQFTTSLRGANAVSDSMSR